MVLTERQQNDLHDAILEYLRDAGPAFTRAAEAFELDAGLMGKAVPRATGLLERKWTSVVRLQKKVLELEERLAHAEQELKAARSGGGAGVGDGAGMLSRSKAGGEASARNLPRAPVVRTLVGHRGGITCLTTHPVYGLLVSGSEDATIKTWDLETGEYERTLKGHTNAVQALAFNRSGSLLASCSNDLSIKLWDFGLNSNPGQECLRTLRGHDHSISGLVFLAQPQGDQLVSCSRDKTLKVWEAASGFCLRTLSGHTDWVRCLAASADGGLLASGGSDQSVIVWNVAMGQPTLTLKEHTHVVESVAFPPAGALEVWMGASSSLSSAAADAVLATPEKGGSGNSNGNNQDSDGDGAHNKDNSSLLTAGTPRRRGLTGAAGNNGARPAFLVSGGRDKTVRVWDLATGLCLLTFAEHENWVRGVCVHPSGQFALSCSDDRSVRVYDLAKGRCIRTLADAHAQFVTAIAQHAMLPYLASGGVDREIKVWECR